MYVPFRKLNQEPKSLDIDAGTQGLGAAAENADLPVVQVTNGFIALGQGQGGMDAHGL
ncbi:MAG: hypothetical protein U0L49_08280 [Eubacterium sp.]|nr:hypothetical protein [Eubacterium sp.]